MSSKRPSSADAKRTASSCTDLLSLHQAIYVKAARHRMSAPGVDGGATLGKTRLLYQGLFNAPNVVGEACKGAALVTEVLTDLGYESNPRKGELRTDIICAVRLLSRENLLAFCEAVQLLSPVGSYIKPTPGMTVGYGDEVVFADGTFIDGSTLELVRLSFFADSSSRVCVLV